MRSLHALRAAMVAELEEISAHYKGIIDHLDALEGLRSSKAPPAKKAPAMPRQKSRGNSLMSKVRAVVYKLRPQAFSITRIREMLPKESPKQVGQCVYLMANSGELYKTGTDASGSSLYKEPA